MAVAVGVRVVVAIALVGLLAGSGQAADEKSGGKMVSGLRLTPTGYDLLCGTQPMTYSQ